MCHTEGLPYIYDDEKERVVQRFGNYLEKKYFNDEERIKLILRHLRLDEDYADAFMSCDYFIDRL